MDKRTSRDSDFYRKIVFESRNSRLIELRPLIPGFASFLSAYLFQGEKNILIDPGPRAAVPGLLAALAQVDMKPGEVHYIAPTHIHIDHAGGVGTILEYMPQARVIVHPRGHEHLVAPGRLWQASLAALQDTARNYLEMEPVPAERLVTATDGMKLEAGAGEALELYFTPGHAPHHLCLFHRESRTLIAGEAAGFYSNGRVRPNTQPPFRLGEMISSLDRLITLNPGTICYAHTGFYDGAVEKLVHIREKILAWDGIVSAALAKGMSAEQAAAVLRREDASLDYLDSLEKADYERDFSRLVISVRGLIESARRPV